MILAMERAIRLMKPNGRIAIVVADGLLDNSSARFVRDHIRTHTTVQAVISLSKATFAGYGAKAKTSILILRNKATPDDADEPSAPPAVFMAMAENTGYAPNGDQVAGNELPDILLDWHAHLRGELEDSQRSWLAEVGDRLDAKFYRARSSVPTADIDAVGGDVASRLAAIQLEYAGFAAEVAAGFSDTSFETVRLGDLLVEQTYAQKVQPDTDYRLLGVRWWGGGTFIREEKKGRDIKGKTLYKIVVGQLIYNRLFAFRGSFAVVPDEHGGCYASNEFPTFVAKENVDHSALVISYIVHAMNSPQYLSAIDAQSTGSTKESRNRFNQALFVDFEIQMPTDEAGLERLVGLLQKANAMRRDQAELLDRVSELREGVSLMLPLPGPA